MLFENEECPRGITAFAERSGPREGGLVARIVGMVGSLPIAFRAINVSDDQAEARAGAEGPR